MGMKDLPLNRRDLGHVTRSEILAPVYLGNG